MTSNRNRSAGHAWEREIVSLLNSFQKLPEVGTARELSKYMDDNKIDVVTKVLTKMEELKLAIQAKNSVSTIPYPKQLSMLKDNLKKMDITLTPVVFHKQTKKVGERFMPKGSFACLYLTDFLKIFLEMVKYEQGYKILNNQFDYIPDEEKEEVRKELEKFGL